MKKLTKLLISFLFVFAVANTASAKDYKLGVVLFHGDNFQNDLDSIVNEIASGDVYREKNGNTLQLVVQTEIPWADTNGSEGVYDFSNYVEYAKELKKRGIKWTPLFSPHYVPYWARVHGEYSKDLTTDKHGGILQGNFLHFSPSSRIWDVAVKNWIDKGLHELRDYIGNSKNDVISEVFVTNEMMYHRGGLDYDYNDDSRSKISTYDDATVNAWMSKYQSRYGVIPRNLKYESSEKQEAFLRFRAEELAYCFNRIKSNTENKLSSLGKRNIPVTWKLTPWAFNAGRNSLEQYHGLRGDQLSYLFNSTNLKMIAIDEYQGGSGWGDIRDAIDKVREFDNANDQKPIYLAEFNRKGGGANRYQVRDWIVNTKNYGVNNWTFFSWNGSSGTGQEGPIEYEQKQGLKLAFDGLIPPDGKQNDPTEELAVKSVITVPSSNATLNSTSVLFKWKNAGADQYFLYVGTTKGGHDIYASSQGKNTSVTVGGLPSNGKKVYVRLWSYVNGGWDLNDYSYTAYTKENTQSKSEITIPSSNTTLNSTSVLFKWKNTGADQYFLYVGTTKGGHDIYASGQGKNTSVTVGGLPSNGKKVYVRLWSYVNGGWGLNDYSYTAYTETDISGNRYIDNFHNTFKGYFGSRVGGNYSCGSSFLCQNYSNNKSIRVRLTDNYLYWKDGNAGWNNYGIR